MTPGLSTNDFEYALDPALIAQQPVSPREKARMLVLDRSRQTWEHARVGDLPNHLRSGDLLVVNDSRVIPARIYARKPTGGRVELLFLEPRGEDRWEALARGGHPRPGQTWTLETRTPATVTILSTPGEGRLELQVQCAGALEDLLEQDGIMPVPPYIRRVRKDPSTSALDRERYQTVYARTPGSVAAPTAGLHFSQALLEKLAHHGVQRAAITLHVGLGTFRPVQTERIDEHRMESERVTVPEATTTRIRETRLRKGRVVAVGSTVVRTLEASADPDGIPQPGAGRTGLFIRPPYTFRAIDAMLTNFHLPRSTLLMMVCALAGKDFMLAAYREAVAQRYRFYSYGDCMLIL